MAHEHSNAEGLRFMGFARISTNSDLSAEYGCPSRLNFCGLSIVLSEFDFICSGTEKN